MCGIFAIINDLTNQAAQSVLEGLKKLEYRGYDSWGIALLPDNKSKIEVEKHVGKISQAKTILPKGGIAVGHTRWATHGGVTDKNAHPHLDCSRKISVIHNGIVENYQILKEQLKTQGHKFISDTDTEVIAHLVEEQQKKQSFAKAVFSVFKMLAGSNAVVVLDLNSRSIVACRNGSPLVAGKGKSQIFLASDVTPFLHYTRRVYFMNDQEGVVLSTAGIKLYDLRTDKEKLLKWQMIDWKVEDAEKGGYPHFLLKEIMEQRETIKKSAVVNKKEIEILAGKIRQGYKVVMVACGTASYCILGAKYFLAKYGITSQAYGAYEFLPFARFCDRKTTLIAVSQSGETADTLIAARHAKVNGSHIVAVVNARGSTLERLADMVLPVGAGPEIAVVSTKAFTSQLVTMYLLSRALAGDSRGGITDVINLEEHLQRWLNKKLLNKIIKLAKYLLDQEDIFVVGKHLNYPSALEFALKIKESSYIHAEAFAAGELKHGVITLVKKGTPCFVLAGDDEEKAEVLSSGAEMKARGGEIIGISPFPSAEFDHYIETPRVNGELSIFPNVIVGQLLGYYLGVGRGTDPDKPRNLAKSVTVK